MIILPAIDLYDGKVVGLRRGDFAAKTEYSDDPLEIAKNFLDMGSRYLHIVDLQGAECGYPKHLDILSRIVRHLDMKVQYGGGLRTKAAIEDAVRAGANRLMIGSIIFKNENIAGELFEQFGEILTPSVDVKGAKVVISGWQEETHTNPGVCVEYLFDIGYRAFLVTAVDRDGTLGGPDLDLYRGIVRQDAYIIASGGIRTAQDVKNLADVGVNAAVVGKAMYEGEFDFKSALALISDAN